MGRQQDEPVVSPEVVSALKPWIVPELALPCVYYDSGFLEPQLATSLYSELRTGLKWETNSSINRMTVLHGEIKDTGEGSETQYHYKDAPSLELLPWTESLLNIKTAVEDWYNTKTGLQVSFNVCLGNYYLDGGNRIGWHTDREEIGRSTPIASISLGAERRFLVRGMSDKTDTAELTLANGSLVVMENLCQHKYVHCVPREREVSEGRINLTFRCKHGITQGEERHAAGYTHRKPGPGEQQEQRASAAQLHMHRGVKAAESLTPTPSSVPDGVTSGDLPSLSALNDRGSSSSSSGSSSSSATLACTMLPTACFSAALAATAVATLSRGNSPSHSLRWDLAAVGVTLLAAPLGVGAALALHPTLSRALSTAAAAVANSTPTAPARGSSEVSDETAPGVQPNDTPAQPALLANAADISASDNDDRRVEVRGTVLFLVTVQMGVEDIVAEEIADLLGASAAGAKPPIVFESTRHGN